MQPPFGQDLGNPSSPPLSADFIYSWMTPKSNSSPQAEFMVDGVSDGIKQDVVLNDGGDGDNDVVIVVATLRLPRDRPLSPAALICRERQFVGPLWNDLIQGSVKRWSPGCVNVAGKARQ